LINYLLQSMNYDEALWKLLNYPTFDFLSFWEYNFDLNNEPYLWTDLNLESMTKFVTPNALLQLRKYDIRSAEEMLGIADQRPILDLRTFRRFCPFGHPDEFAEDLFTRSAFGYGQLFPSGEWCRKCHWKNFYPKTIWPLIDIE